MSSPSFSRDLWDYQGDMKDYLPTRNDRDALVRAAERDPAVAKRIHIWDYFFRVRPDDVGKPQVQYIQVLTEKSKADLRAAKAKAMRQIKIAAPIIVLGIGGIAAKWMWDFAWIPGVIILAIGLIILGWSLRTRATRLARIKREHKEMVAQLNSAVGKLRSKIPTPPDHDQMYRWLRDDIEWLANYALQQTRLHARKVNLDGDNPLCILGPAQLQNPKAIPAPFLNPREADLRKHLSANSFAVLSNGSFADFYGVYYVEFIIVATDMLGNYGCYFDFITGNVYGEHTAEMYYQDVVYLSTKDEYREINVNWFEPKRLVRAPTFSMSLASGDNVQVSFASMDYIAGLKAQIPKESLRLDPERWVNNPELVATKAINALRKHLREHKGMNRG